MLHENYFLKKDAGKLMKSLRQTWITLFAVDDKTQKIVHLEMKPINRLLIVAFTS